LKTRVAKVTLHVAVKRAFVEPPAQHESTSPNVYLLALVSANFSLEKLRPSQAPRSFKTPNLTKIAAGSTAKRARPAALEATVTTVTMPGLGAPDGIFVLGDGTRLFSSGHTILQLTPSGRLSTIAGDPQDAEVALKDGQGIFARFNCPDGLTVDRAGNVVVADFCNHAIRSVAKEGAFVSTLAGGRQEDDEENDDVEEGFADGAGANARINQPMGVVVAANGDIFVADSENHAIRVITPRGAVPTLCGNGQAGFADAQGRARASTSHVVSRWTRRRTCWWPISATTRLGA
jgi:hypothetical protein